MGRETTKGNFDRQAVINQLRQDDERFGDPAVSARYLDLRVAFHELGQPLTNLKGWPELILSSYGDSRSVTYPEQLYFNNFTGPTEALRRIKEETSRISSSDYERMEKTGKQVNSRYLNRVTLALVTQENPEENVVTVTDWLADIRAEYLKKIDLRTYSDMVVLEDEMKIYKADLVNRLGSEQIGLTQLVIKEMDYYAGVLKNNVDNPPNFVGNHAEGFEGAHKRLRGAVSRLIEEIPEVGFVYEISDYEVKPTDVDINEVIKESLSGLTAGMEFVPDVNVEEYGGSEAIRIDRRLFELVFDNVGGNAFKYIDEDAVSQSVLISVVDDGENIKFVVKDSGIGMSAEAVGKMNSDNPVPGRQDDVVEKGFPGSGIGIYMLRKIVLPKMGGRMEYASEGEGKGTTVTVTLPKRFEKPKAENQ